MSVSVYIPMYYRDEDLAAMLCLAGTIKDAVGWGFFYYPLFLCPTEDGSSVLLDVFGVQAEVHIFKEGLKNAPTKIYDAKSYVSFIQAISETKDILDRIGSEEVVLRNLVTDPTVLSEVRDCLARGEFEAIEGAMELDGEAGADFCEKAAAFDDVKNGLLLNISIMDELVDAVKNTEKFILEMMDKEKEVMLRVHDEATDGIRLRTEKEAKKMEKRIDNERTKIIKRTKGTRLRLETRLKKLVSRYREEEKKEVTYEERGKKTKKKSWLTLAKRHEERAKKWRKKAEEVEKDIDKAEEEAGKQLKRLEEEKERWMREGKAILKERGKEREEIQWRADQRRRYASTVCQDLCMKAQAKRNSQTGTLNTLTKYRLEAPLKERTKICVPFIAVRSRGDISRAFTFILPRTVDPTKRRGILGLIRPNLKNFLQLTHEHLFQYIEGNLEIQARRGRITTKLVEGTAKPPSIDGLFREALSKGLERLQAMKLLEPTAVREYVSWLKGVGI